MKDESCCVVTCDVPLDQAYWDSQYQAHTLGWDLGQISPPLKSYIDTIQNKDSAVLIPGCGNTYEAKYMLDQGFTNITVIDIAPTLVNKLLDLFQNNPNITILLGDFFEHQGSYDLIIEQTFFCALPPKMRQKYVWKNHQLLSNKGILAGLLFNRNFEVSPPFGGNLTEYEALFQHAFHFNTLAPASNSVEKRKNVELFFEFQKNNLVTQLYNFEGITCTGCKNTVTTKFLTVEGVLNVSMNSDFSEVLLVSSKAIELELLRDLIAYDEHYTINLYK